MAFPFKTKLLGLEIIVKKPISQIRKKSCPYAGADVSASTAPGWRCNFQVRGPSAPNGSKPIAVGRSVGGCYEMNYSRTMDYRYRGQKQEQNESGYKAESCVDGNPAILPRK
jgi:hypothetical protein